MNKVHPISDFNPDPNSNCICGGQKIFKDCCGSQKLNRGPPYGVWMKQSFLRKNVCDRLIARIKNINEEADLKTINKTGSVYKETVHPDRVTTKIKLGKPTQEIVNQWVKKTFEGVIPKELRRKIKSFEIPDLMLYKKGGSYRMHADSEHFDTDLGVWKRVVDRDLSLLIYLNDDFEGGELHFNRFNYTYTPSKGDLVVFPAHNLYLHEARPVVSGERFVIVSWAAFN